MSTYHAALLYKHVGDAQSVTCSLTVSTPSRQVQHFVLYLLTLTGPANQLLGHAGVYIFVARSCKSVTNMATSGCHVCVLLEQSTVLLATLLTW